jgi:DnaK suppressor protein
MPKAAAKAKKPAAKAQPAARPAAKKAAVKAPAKKAPAKPAAKVPTKAAKPAAKPVAKSAAKTVAKVAAKAVKAVKDLVKAVKPAAKAATPAAKKPAIAAKAASAPVQAPTAAKASPRTPPATAATVPAKPPATSGLRQAPTSRSAALLASQAAAPIGAKATYTPMASTTLLNPPPTVAIKKDPKLANNWKTKSAEELSDDEVLAMPDTEYMNDKQMAFFRVKLLQLKQDILNSAGETTEHLREETVIVPDPADRATIEEEHALELRTRDRERKLLKKIEQSIARIDAGDYGYCDETGEPIGVGRLLARPTATLSLEAQQRRELKQKMFGD